MEQMIKEPNTFRNSSDSSERMFEIMSIDIILRPNPNPKPKTAMEQN